MKSPAHLNLNEMPYLPPKEVLEEARKGIDKLNRYASSEDLQRLKHLVAHYAGTGEQHIIIGPGSDFLLREIILLLAANRKIVMVSPSFLPTVETAKRLSKRLVRIRLRPPDFRLDEQSLVAEIDQPSLVIIDNPNNPTGAILMSQRTAEAVLQKPDTFLVTDEAYYEFSRMTLSPLIDTHENLIISHTLDKAFSLAGARVGYLLAGNQIVEAMTSFAPILPQPCLLAALQALSDPDYMKANVSRIISERKRVQKMLEPTGADVYGSHTNFLLINTHITDAAELLKTAGVLVSNVSGQLPSEFIRVTIGTSEENDRFIDALKSI